MIPIPFSEGVCEVIGPYYVPPEADERRLEEIRLQIENELNKVCFAADKAMGIKKVTPGITAKKKDIPKTNKVFPMFIRIYNILIRILYPLVIKRYINKRKQNGKEDLKRFNERVGRPQLKRPDGKLIWLHGASVGESLSMLPLINRLLDLYPEAHVMVTTGTITSAELMGKRLPERAFHQYIPIDNPVFTTRFIRHWRPDLVLWFESDLWPAMLSGISRKTFR